MVAAATAVDGVVIAVAVALTTDAVVDVIVVVAVVVAVFVVVAVVIAVRAFVVRTNEAPFDVMGMTSKRQCASCTWHIIGQANKQTNKNKETKKPTNNIQQTTNNKQP